MLLQWSKGAWARSRFTGSSDFWVQCYGDGKGSGLWSRGYLSEFKAEIINSFVREHKIRSVIELGCGDGNQLKLAEYDKSTGLDISPDAITLCRRLFSGDTTKTFGLVDEYRGETAELAISLDVVYHLVEDDVYFHYLKLRFGAARRFVIIYSSNTDSNLDATFPPN